MTVKNYNSIRESINKPINIGKYARAYRPKPIDDDYTRGYIIRYFAQPRNINSGSVVEIDKSQFDSHGKKDRGLSYSYYKVVSLRWKLTGTGEEIIQSNNLSISNAEKIIIGIKIILSDSLQFARVTK